MTVKELVGLFEERHIMDKVDNYQATWNSNALGGELGEVQNLIKKKDFYTWYPEYAARHDEKVAKGKRVPFDEAFEDEMGDTLFYYLGLVKNLGLDLEKIALRQAKKLAGQDKLYGRKRFRK